MNIREETAIAINMRINYIETGDMAYCAQDIVNMGSEPRQHGTPKLRRLSGEQIDLLGELRKTRDRLRKSTKPVYPEGTGRVVIQDELSLGMSVSADVLDGSGETVRVAYTGTYGAHFWLESMQKISTGVFILGVDNAPVEAAVRKHAEAVAKAWKESHRCIID